MKEIGANKSRFFLETSGLEPNTFQIVDFVGQEDISQIFRFDLNLVSIEKDLEFSDILNKPATLIFAQGDEPVRIQGIISDFHQGGRTADWVAYRAVLVPRLWLLSLTYQSRVFQNMSVENILEEVFKGSGLSSSDFRFALTGNYPKREYCVQYRETDLNFVSRLMEYEGMHFFVEHDDKRDTIVVVDDRSKTRFIEGEKRLSYHAPEGMVDDQGIETIREFVARERIVTGKVILKDYNYRTPETQLKTESQINSKMPGMFFEYGQHFKDSAEGKRLAKVRNEEIECTRRVMTGGSNCARLHAGLKISLEDHFRDDLNGDYLLTHVNHYGSQGAGFGVGSGSPSYRNDFTCIPADVQYREPRLTPEPRIPGIMTAKVETSGGDYAHIDGDGRYKVKMPFDLGDKKDGNASRAIRMAQPYSGPGYGIHFPNHAGTEIVWACVDGNVDRPLGLSTVPNPSNASPSVAGNKAQSVIRTAGQNELTMDDTIGSENIYLHGTKDWTIDIVNDKKQTIGHDETLSVGHDQSATIGNNQTLSVGVNRDKTVGSNQTETIGANKTITVGANHTESVGANMDQTVGVAKTETVGAAKMTTIGAAYQITVGAAMNETVGAIKAEEIGADKVVSVGSNSSEDVGANKIVTVGKDITISSGKKMMLSAGDDFALAGGKKGVIEIKDQLTIKCGSASITMKKNGDIQIKGNNISIKGSDAIKIKAPKIGEN